MNAKDNLENIVKELTTAVDYVEEKQVACLVDTILEANHIFLAGAGRSGIAIRAFGNRLMHLGFSVSIVGEITSPHTAAGDLLIVGSGSGETESLVSLSQKAKSNGVKIGLVTMAKESAIAKQADVSVILPGVSPKLKGEAGSVDSIQPMGSMFEQMCFLTYDAVIMTLMERLEQSAEEMFGRHANLE